MKELRGCLALVSHVSRVSYAVNDPSYPHGASWGCARENLTRLLKTMLESPFQQFPAYYSVIAFVLLWVLVCILVSFIGGWRELAKDYRADFPVEARTLKMKSARMRWGTNYTACIKFGASRMGLYLSMAWFLRMGHPPLFVPWTDVETEEGRHYPLIKTVRLRFLKHPNIPLIISKRLAERIFHIRDESLTGLSIEPS